MEVSAYLDHCLKDAASWAAVPVPVAASFLNITREAVGERIRARALKAVSVKEGERSWKLVLISSLVGSQKDAKALESDLDERITGLLEEAARVPTTVNYGMLMDKVNMSYRNPQHRREIGATLGRISEKSIEGKDRKFMLSALAVGKGTGLPNEAFFDLAIRLGQMGEGDDQEAFWRGQRDQIYRYYQRGK